MFNKAGLKDFDDSITVEENYHPTVIVGQGATSVVFKALFYENATDNINSDSYVNQLFDKGQVDNLENATLVAIKKVRNVFSNDETALRLLREIRLLRILKGHKNIINFKGIMRIPESDDNFDSINIVTEYCAQNLMKVLKLNAKLMTSDHVKYLTFEIA